MSERSASSVYNAVYRPSLSAWGLTEEEFDTTEERLALIFPIGSPLNFFFTVPTSTIKERFDVYQNSWSNLEKILVPAGLFFLFFQQDAKKRRRWPEAILIAGIFLPLWIFSLTYASSAYDQFFTLTYPFLYIWLGLGISAVFTLSSRLLERFSGMQKKHHNLTILFLTTLIAIAPFWQARESLISAWANGYTRDIQKAGVYPIFATDQKARLARKVVNKLEVNAIVFADWDRLYTFYYVAHVERGLTRIAFHQAYIGDGATEVAESLEAYIAENIDSRPIYTTIPLLDLIPFYTFGPVSDDLLRLHKRE